MSPLVDELIAAGLSAGASESRAAMFDRAERALRAVGVEPRHWVHVPGRIEVLGKHTDYAGGRSLLAAVELGFCVVSAPRTDPIVRLIAVDRAEEVFLSFDPGAATPAAPAWVVYPAAVVRRLARDFNQPLQGADIAFASDLPASSGLSSSSALLIATFEALSLANDLDDRDDFRAAFPGPLDLAAYLGSVESGRPFRVFAGDAGVGTSGGSQDHTAILASEAGRIIQVGYAPPRIEGSVALPRDVIFVIAVSGVAAEKTAGARESYNRTAALSAALLDLWRSTTARTDATLFEAVTSSRDACGLLREAIHSGGAAGFGRADLEARLDQFVDETLVLIPAAFDALGAGDLEGFGRAVDRSQRGAENGLGNQIRETKDLARLARSLGAHAASAFGAGFGGSVWALVSRAEASSFQDAWERAYRDRHDRASACFFATEAGPALIHPGANGSGARGSMTHRIDPP